MEFILIKFLSVFIIFTCTEIHGAERNNNSSKCQSCEKEFVWLETYSSSQVSTHNTRTTGIWVTYRSGVYDLTEFVDVHPGGLASILAASGGRLERYWNFLPVHKRQHVYILLEKYRIGNLISKDRLENEMTFDPFTAEQRNRSYDMEIIADKPYNANPYSADLLNSFITPNNLHYVRLHLPIPQIDLKDHTITLKGFDGENESTVLTVTVEDLQTNFKKSLLNATLQCSGNRRFEMNKIKLTHGVVFKHTAISTATWGGVRLMEVLIHFFGHNPKLTKHGVHDFVNFEGADTDSSGQHFGASIPADIALDPQSDLFLAYEMNGVSIPAEHGFPIRLIGPGMAGFKSVKFLRRISLEDREVDTVWERRMYRFYRPHFYWDNIDYDSSPSLIFTNVQSAILSPLDKEAVRMQIGGQGQQDFLLVMGYAFSGGGNGVRRVDVTVDQGETWMPAQILGEEPQWSRRRWTWVLWQVKIHAHQLEWGNSSKLLNSVSIACRAFDSQYNSQPKDVRTIWNMMGVLVNHWHNISITLLHTPQLVK